MAEKHFKRLITTWASWDKEEARIAAFLHVILLLILAACVAMLVITAATIATGSFQAPGLTIVLVSSLALLSLGLLVMNQRGHTRVAAGIHIVSLWFMITFMASKVDGVFDVSVLVYFTLTAISGLLLGRYGVVGSTVLNLIGIAVLGVVQPYPTKILLLFSSDTIFRPVTTGLVVVITSVVFFLAIYNVRTAVRHAQRELVERKRAEEAERDQRKLAEGLRDIAAALTASLNPDEVLDRVLDNVQRVLPHDAVLVAFLEDGEVSLARERTYDEQITIPTDRPESIPISTMRYLKRAADTGEPVIIPDTSAEKGWVHYDGLEWIESYMAIPIRIDGQIIGFIILLGRHAGQFSPTHMDRLQAFADQTAIAIQNARLYSELEGYNLKLQEAVAGATREMSEAKEQLETIVDNSPDAILLLNPDGQILAANPAFEMMFGYEAGAVIGAPISHLMGSDNAAMLEKALLRVRDEGESARLELAAQTHVGSVFDADIALAPVPSDQDGAFRIVCNLRDITPLKQVERIKDTFVSVAAHELRTPLTSILGFSEILTTRELPEERRQRYLTTINEQSAQLKAIIDDMLDLSRLESGRGLDIKPEPINVNNIVEDAIEPFLDTTPNHTFDCTRPDEEPTVYGDAFRLGQVVRNIVSNAVKYSPKGGTIAIETKTLPDTVEVSVSDEGIGIAADQMEHIFERFYRAQGADMTANGTGLGLAISKLIVEAHDGTISVDSEVGVGTTFTFTVSRRQPELA